MYSSKSAPKGRIGEEKEKQDERDAGMLTQTQFPFDSESKRELKGLFRSFPESRHGCLLGGGGVCALLLKAAWKIPRTHELPQRTLVIQGLKTQGLGGSF